MRQAALSQQQLSYNGTLLLFFMKSKQIITANKTRFVTPHQRTICLNASTNFISVKVIEKGATRVIVAATTSRQSCRSNAFCHKDNCRVCRNMNQSEDAFRYTKNDSSKTEKQKLES